MNQLVIHRHFAAPVADVFDAWCNPETLRRWFAPGDAKVPEASADPTPGGRYRIVMESSDCNFNTVGGEYLAVKANELLEFTWSWEGSEAVTRVRVEVQPSADGGTDLTLTHSQFADVEQRDKHVEGWAACLVNLEQLYVAAIA